MHPFFFRCFCSGFLTLLVIQGAIAQTPPAPLINEQVIPIWGNGPAPDTKGVMLDEQGTESGSDPQVPQRSVTHISTPTLTAFVPAHPNGAAIVVMPGGGYNKIVFGKEGIEIARWLNSIGITAFVLKYRLPAEWPGVGHNMPYQDAQRAMRLLRANVKPWGLDAKRIGVIGFSAGGNLAANVGTDWNRVTHDAVDDIDKENARPDVMMLVYANFENPAPHLLLMARSLFWSNEYINMAKDFEPIAQVTSNTSPAFILAAHNDAKVPAAQSAKFYLALLKAKVSAELHIYRDGEHGFAISKTKGLPIADWTNQCTTWLKQMEFIEK